MSRCLRALPFAAPSSRRSLTRTLGHSQWPKPPRFVHATAPARCTAKRKHDHCMIPRLFHCFQSWNLWNLSRRILLSGLYVPRSQWGRGSFRRFRDYFTVFKAGIFGIFPQNPASKTLRFALARWRLINPPRPRHSTEWPADLFRRWRGLATGYWHGAGV